MIAAKHSKAGVTIDRELADLNQQNTEPHLRLMEWVWNYFIDGDVVDPGPSAGNAGMESKSKDAGATHSQPSSQASGDAHWETQQGRKSKHQKRTGEGRYGEGHNSGAESSKDALQAASVTRSGKPPDTCQ